MIHCPPHNSDVLLLCLRFCALKYLDVTFMINMETGVNLLKLICCATLAGAECSRLDP